jgi:hypothetical protein
VDADTKYDVGYTQRARDLSGEKEKNKQNVKHCKQKGQNVQIQRMNQHEIFATSPLSHTFDNITAVVSFFHEICESAAFKFLSSSSKLMLRVSFSGRSD